MSSIYNPVTRRKVERQKYVRIFVGDAQFTDDINDDWFCISFNGLYLGDFCPNNIYINKKDGKVKIKESNVFAVLLTGFLVHQTLQNSYKFQRHHRLILERFVNDTFQQYTDNAANLSRISLENILITVSRQRV